MRRTGIAGNFLTHRSSRQKWRLQFALGVSFLLHALVYVHYLGASMEGVDAATTGSRRAALSVSLLAAVGGSPSDSPRLPGLTSPASFSSRSRALVASPQAPDAGEKLAGPTADGNEKLPPDEPYYTRDMLNRPAQPLVDIRLPPELLPLVPPKLLLELWIDKHGNVRRVLPIEPVQVSPAILRSFDVLRFAPASRNGLPVNSRKLLELAVDSP